MKLLKKSLIALTTIASVSVPILSVTSCKSNSEKKEEDPTLAKDVFDVKDGVLMGLKQGVTQDDIRTNIKNNTLVLPAVDTIKEEAFIDGSLLNALPDGTKLVIPANNVGDYAFYGSDKTSIEVELKKAKKIGKSAFAQMLGLTKVTLPNTLTSIGANAFLGDKSLSTINVATFTVENPVPTFENLSAFVGIAPKGRLELKDIDSAEIGSRLWAAFNQHGMASDWIQTTSTGGIIHDRRNPTPDYFLTYEDVEGTTDEVAVSGFNLMYIEDWEPYNTLTIPDTVTVDGQVKKVTVINDAVFCDNPTLLITQTRLPYMYEIRFSQYLKKIGKYNFAKIPNLRTVRMTSPDAQWLPNLTEIGDYAFYKSSYLENFLFTKDLIIDKIGTSAFEGCTNLYMDHPNDALFFNSESEIGESAFSGCNYIRAINFENSNITEIKPYTFYSCEKLWYVRFYDPTDSNKGVSMIHEGAFESTILSEIHLGKNIQYIQEGAFTDTNLKFAVMEENTTHPYYFSDTQDLLLAQDVTTITSILKSGKRLYRRHTFFKDRDFLIDNAEENTLYLDWANDSGREPTQDCWKSTLPSGCTFDWSDQKFWSPKKIEGSGNVQLTMTFDDPFTDEKYSEVDTFNFTFINNSQREDMPFMPTVKYTVYEDPLLPSSLQAQVEIQNYGWAGTAENNWTYKIADVVTIQDSQSVWCTCRVTQIKEEAFSWGHAQSPQIPHYSLPSTLRKINMKGFDKAGNEHPEVLEHIGTTPRIFFRGTNYLDNGTALFLDATAFYCLKGGPRFDIPYGVTKLISNVFYEWELLEEISIPWTMTEFDSAAIYKCPDMKRLVLPAGTQWQVAAPAGQKFQYTADTPEKNWEYFNSHPACTWTRTK